MNKNILVGNGVNIAFSKNDDYKNYAIINRLTRYLNTNRYDDVFKKSISSEELRFFLEKLNQFFKEMLEKVGSLKLTQNEDELKTLIDISRRYQNKPKDLMNVGIEDYFFIMKMVFNRFGDAQTPINSLYDGLKYLFLDSLYNDGAIQQLYKKMGCLSNELDKYAEIFTVNYDNNLEQLTSKNVHHLHGNFSVLDDTYRTETIIGYLAQHKANPPHVVQGKEHLFCNAIMSFSGKSKLDRMELYPKSNKALDDFISELNDPENLEFKKVYEIIKTSSVPEHVITRESVEARLINPNLRNTEYPLNVFRSIFGELHILGFSPNNDSHLIEMINNNPHITRITYFSASIEDTNSARRVFRSDLVVENVHDYWKRLGI